MNEKIKQLIGQATVKKHWDKEDELWDESYVDQQKFAELLLQEFAYECIDVTNQGERIQWIAKKWGISI